jgi:hypothetical protein
MPAELRTFFRPVMTMMSNWRLIFAHMNRSIDAVNAAGSGYVFEFLRAKARSRYGNTIPWRIKAYILAR